MDSSRLLRIFGLRPTIARGTYVKKNDRPGRYPFTRANAQIDDDIHSSEELLKQ